jgi:hypothetical protein
VKCTRCAAEMEKASSGGTEGVFCGACTEAHLQRVMTFPRLRDLAEGRTLPADPDHAREGLIDPIAPDKIVLVCAHAGQRKLLPAVLDPPVPTADGRTIDLIALCEECKERNVDPRTLAPATRVASAVDAIETPPAARDPSLASSVLIDFYGLEGEALGGASEADAHDASRFAAWLRSDEGRAGLILAARIEKGGPLEDCLNDVAARRTAALIGFLRQCPSQGKPPGEDAKARHAAAADRIRDLVADRYEKRYLSSPPAEALVQFRASHDLWIDEAGDLGAMADAMAKYRDANPKAWARRALLPPKDPLRALHEIARWVSSMLSRDEVERG